MRRWSNVLRSVSWRDAVRWKEVGAFLLVIAACVGWRLVTGPARATAQPPLAKHAAGGRDAANPATKPAGKPAVAALVNGTAIGWEQLTAEAVARHGDATLDSLVNRAIIEQACARQGIAVTPEEVSAEIDGMARRFGLPRDRFLELIQQERGFGEKQYSNEIVWPMLALRRLARGSVQPTQAQLQAAFESRFGPAVKARIIVARTLDEARKLRGLALGKPEEFGAIARRSSVDVGTASANGWVQPIRRHTGDAAFEKAAFSLRDGEISEVIQVADQFIVLKCEGHLPASGVKLDDVREKLVAELSEQASRAASAEFFRTLERQAKVEKRLDTASPTALSAGTAAVVDGVAIPTETVAAACLERHGEEVLEILVTKTLISQALTRQKLAVEPADVEQEIDRAARSLGFTKQDGSADVDAWLRRVTQDDRVPMRHYIDDIVRPTVALKKLVGPVTVTNEDLGKAYDATFGPRARCRMIVLDSQRRAQEVWQLARQNPTPEFIGELAEKYSADPASRALRGEVPPIQRYGGQPTLEREAFSLQPGEVSGIVQVADRFMILFLEGFTEPMKVTVDEVKQELKDDIQEKKQRIEMTRFFTYLREGASIDNFLTGTSQTPTQQSPPPTAGLPPAKLPAAPDLLPGREPLLPRAEAESLARPRAGSRIGQPSPAGKPQSGGGVVPASLDTPAVK